MTGMDPELKLIWIAALRSGEYRQGRCDLYNAHTDKYCCLGVLCAVAGKDRHDVQYAYEDAVGSKRAKTLWRLNDVKKASFSEIADYIEANL